MAELSYNEQRRADMHAKILVRAKEYFVEHGISNGLQMKEIAVASGTSRQTLYSYFKNIDEIAFALANECATNAMNYIAAQSVSTATPLECICNAARSILSFGIALPNDAIYLYLFDAYKHNKPSAELAENYESIYRGTTSMHDLVLAGIKCGEIRPDVDAALAQGLLVNMFLSLSMRLCVVSNSREEMLYLGLDRFCDEVVEMLCKYLKK